MRTAHADPTRKLLIARIRDAETDARRLRRGVGRRWGTMEHVLAALVGRELREALRALILCIYRVQDEFGQTEGVTWKMPSLSDEARRVFAARQFVTILDDSGRLTVEGDALADAYAATLLAMAKREIPDSTPPAPLN